MKNQVNLIGYVGQDPEIRNLGNGKKLARFSVATHSYYTTRTGERKEETQWHQVVAWNKTADIIERFVSKGRLVNIDGQIVYRQFEDRNGVKHTVAEIRAENVRFLDRK